MKERKTEPGAGSEGLYTDLRNSLRVFLPLASLNAPSAQEADQSMYSSKTQFKFPQRLA